MRLDCDVSRRSSSLQLQWGRAVYGYYIDDIWEPVVLSRTVATYAEGFTALDAEIILDWFCQVGQTQIMIFQRGKMDITKEWTSGEVDTEYTRNTTQMTIGFDGFSFSGERKYVDSYDLVNTYANQTNNGGTQNWFITQFGTGAACEYTTESAAAFYSVPCGTYASCPDQNGNYFNYLTNYVYQCVRTMVAETATKYDERT